MKTFPALLLIASLLLSPLARGINPTMPLETFDKERGFPEVSAIAQRSDGMTHFTIMLNPAVFLSQFRHGFPRDRKTEVSMRLVCHNDGQFKGPSVELGTVSSEVTEHLIQFSIPSADLEHYQLDFQCSIPPIDEVMIIGGELYQASLKAVRDAKQTITENSPVWKEMEARRPSAAVSPGAGSHSFGGGSEPRVGRADEPAAEK